VNARGFTLLESLVTLVIVAMVATLLMQSLFQVLGLRERVLRTDRDARIAALQEAWFRDSVGGVIGELAGREGAFRGTAEGWTALTLGGLADPAQVKVTWRIAGPPERRVLEVAEGQGPAVAVRTVSGSARFQFLDAAGQWQEVWPVAARPREVLPRIVRLEDPEARPGWVWQAAIPAGQGVPQSVRAQSEPTIDARLF